MPCLPGTELIDEPVTWLHQIETEHLEDVVIALSFAHRTRVVGNTSSPISGH